jgi:hypothetical protein
MRYARSDEYPRISKFLDEFWAKQHVYVRTRSLFDWTFHRVTHWNPEQYSFALAEDETGLTGILGGIPFTFNHFGKTSPGVWIVNYVIRPDHRKGPAALQLLGIFRKPEFDPVIAFGINPATTAIYRVLRGRVLPEIPRLVMVLPEAQNRFATLLSIAHPEWTDARASEMAAFFTCKCHGKERVQANAELPANWDDVDWPDIAQKTVGAARDSEFLKWRYLDHPNFKYKLLSIAEGERHGLVVWRLETIQRNAENGRVDLDRIGRIVEFLPVSDANAEMLVGALVQDLRANDAVAADFYSFHGAARQHLQRLGFTPAALHPEGDAIPSRFQPLDGKGGGILSAMFLQQQLPECSDASDCPWYWTKSDSDQDRPN